METTIREIINGYQKRLTNMNDMTPNEASKILVELSAFWGNVNSKLIETQMEFNKHKLKCLDEVKSVAKAQVMAETSMEWQWYQEVKGYSELVKEMIRGIKYYVRTCQDEYNN